ncbi:MAG: UbiA prenyltransferase family protein [Flavobacteriales bacterium]|nr:UbiA prenyltransferase family protein [Flavobacteriales bacterium]
MPAASGAGVLNTLFDPPFKHHVQAMKLGTLRDLLRAEQWVKNGFLVLPAFFAGNILAPGVLPQVLLGMVAFSLVASSIYIVNDLRDAPADRLHPRKCKRPIAAGLVKPSFAIAVACVLAAIGLGSAFLLNTEFGLIALGYGLMNLAYSLYLKRWAILDVMIIALGFILRIHGGGALAEVPISMWLEILTFLLALFIAFGKRRDEVLVSNSSGNDARRSIQGYNLEMVNTSMALIASVTLVAYLMYTVSPEVMDRIGNTHVYYTAFFVLMGMLRYLQLALVKNRTGSPTRLVYEDWPLQAIIVGWLITFALILYAR